MEELLDVVPVSVVVPTRGRPDAVVRAVRSVLVQTCGPLEVLVVLDGPDPTTRTALEAVADPRVRVLEHERSRGAAAARNTGIAAAAGEWVALLDDDDTWRPTKLARQWETLAGRPAEKVVLSCGVAWSRDGGTQEWPTRAPRPGEPVAEYLFCRRRAGEGFLATPTILLPRALAAACLMPEHLAVHEDLDWFLDLEDAGARFEVVLEPLVDVDGAEGRASLSASGTAERSLAWALSRRDRLGRRAFAAFCLTEVARALGRPAPVGTTARVLRHALSGAPAGRDLLAFASIVLVPSRVRWALRRLLDRGSG